MNLRAVAALAGLALAAGALAACDNPKPRVVPPDPMARALPAPAAAVGPPKDGTSDGLERRTEPAAFYLDRIGEALDPANRQPAGAPGDAPIAISGFGFDPAAKTPASGVDVVIDGAAYAATYGAPREDVANYFKTPALVPTGYTLTLPAGFLVNGPHKIVVRVIAADGKGYFESPQIPFTVD